MLEAKDHLYQTAGLSRCLAVADKITTDDCDEWDLNGPMPVTFEEGVRYERALGLRLAQSLRRRFGSHETLPELLDVADSHEWSSWLWALGELWPSFDNIGRHRDELLEQVRARADDIETVIPELMDKEELAAFEVLPDELVIYRGCGPHNVRGLSWSLKREVAAKFPYYDRYHTYVPMLLTARIPKSRAAALKLGRKEHEIIVLDHFEDPSLRWTGEFLKALPE